MAAGAVMTYSFRQWRRVTRTEVLIRPWGLGESRKWVRANPRMKNASGEFCRGFFGFSKIRCMVWSFDSRCKRDVGGHEVEDQGHDIKTRSIAC